MNANTNFSYFFFQLFPSSLQGFLQLWLYKSWKLQQQQKVFLISIMNCEAFCTSRVIWAIWSIIRTVFLMEAEEEKLLFNHLGTVQNESYRRQLVGLNI